MYVRQHNIQILGIRTWGETWWLTIIYIPWHHAVTWHNAMLSDTFLNSIPERSLWQKCEEETGRRQNIYPSWDYMSWADWMAVVWGHRLSLTSLGCEFSPPFPCCLTSRWTSFRSESKRFYTQPIVVCGGVHERKQREILPTGQKCWLLVPSGYDEFSRVSYSILTDHMLPWPGLGSCSW